MALYTCVTADRDGALCTGVAVSSADTISGNDVNAGAILIVTAAATPSIITFTDPGRTPAGTPAGTLVQSTVGANTSQAFTDLAGYINSTTNLVTVNYSATTNVTAMLVKR